MQNFGAELRAHREKRGIRLEEIASITKIHLHSLELLESGQWDQLPPEPFLRGFITAYAKYVGLNPTETLDRYYAEMGKSLGPELLPPQELDARSSRSSRSSQPTPADSTSGLLAAAPSRQKLWIAGSTVGALIFVGILVYVGQRSSSPTTPAKTTENSVEKQDSPDLLRSAADMPKGETVLASPGLESRSVATKDITTSGAEKSATTEAEKANSKKKHEIEILSKERTWIKVVIDDNPPQELFLNEGQKVNYVADEKIKVVLGNSAGSKVLHNGKPVEGVRFMGTIRSYRFPANARFPQDLATRQTTTDSGKEGTPPSDDRQPKSLSPGL